MYLALLESLGPTQSLILIDKLMIDVKNARRGLQAALSAKAPDLLNEPSQVLISLAGVVGVEELHGLAKNIYDYKQVEENTFPFDDVKVIIAQLDQWLEFLKSDKISRGQTL
ncbi:MAG: hypothetical protein IME92_09690 [Proteobacteria bacterium]|nr:hypothetical protein [Pseudomonadota bacterium]